MYKELLINLISGVSIIFGDFDFCDNYAGMHYHQSSTIKVCDNYRDRAFTLVHELGHEYWFTVMTQEQREEYKKMQTYKRVDYSRDYAMTNEKEDFADGFANIILGRDWLNKSQNYRDKRKYITELIK